MDEMDVHSSSQATKILGVSPGATRTMIGMASFGVNSAVDTLQTLANLDKGAVHTFTMGDHRQGSL